jgi:hypothetical protein
MGRRASVRMSEEVLWNFLNSPYFVWIASRIGREGEERACLFDLLDVRVMPVNDVPLQVSDGFVRLTKASEFDVLLEPEVEF